jgi:hypothetical protein
LPSTCPALFSSWAFTLCDLCECLSCSVHVPTLRGKKARIAQGLAQSRPSKNISWIEEWINKK